MDTVPKSVTKRKPPDKGGSRKGIPNRSTALARGAIASFVDGNAHKLQEWLDEIAADEKLGPHAAFRCLMDVMEYHVPKLARTELAGDPDNPLKIAAELTDNELAAIVLAVAPK